MDLHTLRVKELLEPLVAAEHLGKLVLQDSDTEVTNTKVATGTMVAASIVVTIANKLALLGTLNLLRY